MHPDSSTVSSSCCSCGHCHKVCRRNPQMLGVNVPFLLDRCTF